ncbi:Tyrosine N-monooxygenase [Hordeum vulgare]|nr:Tyrosine N-monooxygenase [Hordeum vulgare]
MAPPTTSTTGGVASAPAVKPRSALLKLPNGEVAKTGKVSGKKNEAVDDSSRRPKKRLTGRATDAVATEAPLTIGQNLFQGEEMKTKKGKIKKGRPFTLPHCYDVLKDDEKWKPREGVNEESNKRKQTIDLDDEEEASSDDGKRSLTLNSIAYSKPKRPDGGKKDAKEKKKRKGDDELKMLWKLL